MCLQYFVALSADICMQLHRVNGTTNNIHDIQVLSQVYQNHKVSGDRPLFRRPAIPMVPKGYG